MIIDSHIHLTTIEHWKKSDLSNIVSNVLKQMDSVDIDKAVILNLTNPIYADNVSLAEVLTKHNDRFFYFANLDYLHYDSVDQIETLVKEHGFSGLKIHPRFQCLDPLNSYMYPIYEKAIDLNIPVLICCFMQSKIIELEKIQPYAIDKLAKMYPDLKIIMAHSGWPRVWDSYHIVKSNDNVYMDLSLILTKFKQTSIIKDMAYMLETLDRKIIYGSDYPEVSFSDYLNEFHQVSSGLSQEKIDNICYKNILKILGES